MAVVNFNNCEKICTVLSLVAGWVEMFIGVIEAVVALFIPAPPDTLFRLCTGSKSNYTRTSCCVKLFYEFIFCIFHICGEQYSDGNFIDERTLGEWRVFLASNFPISISALQSLSRRYRYDWKTSFPLDMSTYPLKVKLHIILRITRISTSKLPRARVKTKNFPDASSWSVGQKIKTICWTVKNTSLVSAT